MFGQKAEHRGMEFRSYGSGSKQVILVPGGPGLPSGFYQELTEGLSKSAEVVTYEHSGSTDPQSNEFPRTMEEYVDELLSVVEEAGSGGRPQVLLGHSFGVTVAIEAIVTRGVGSAALLLNGFHSSGMLKRGLQARREALPEPFHVAYKKLSRESLTELLPLLGQYFYPRHLCRLDPWPQSFLDNLAGLNLTLAEHWLGSDFFECNGALEPWDRSGELTDVDIPALVVSGRNDYYLESDNRAFSEALPKGELWISESASHTPWVEDGEAFFERVQQFLYRVG